LAARCEQALAHRPSQRLRRHLQESHLPVKTLERFDFAACPALNSVRIAQFARYPDGVERPENLLLFGPWGVGKTPRAAAIGYGLIEQGVRVLLGPPPALVQSLQPAPASKCRRTPR
jgi:DNA replication protein DnaC